MHAHFAIGTKPWPYASALTTARISADVSLLISAMLFAIAFKLISTNARINQPQQSPLRMQFHHRARALNAPCDLLTD
jgi:hypothetical protein